MLHCMAEPNVGTLLALPLGLRRSERRVSECIQLPAVGAPLLYQSIAQNIIDRIAAGTYPVGSVMPREVDLAAEFAVSRATVREAMRLLATQNLVIRRKRAGTVVAHRKAPTSNGTVLYDPARSGTELMRNTSLVISSRSRRVLPSLVAEEVAEAAEPWLYAAGVRVPSAGGQVLCTTEVFLHPRLEKAAHLVGREPGLIHQLIARTCGERMRRVRTRIQPCRLTAKQARLTQVATGSLGTRVVRTIYNDAEELLEVVIGTYPAHSFSFEVSFDLGHDTAS
jgi:GntR family transcriptional regulator